MKKLIILGVLLLVTTSCTPLKRAQTGLARGIAGSTKIEIDGNEVYCSQGKVCAEVEVMAIWVENRDGGTVRVVLKNRTGNTALVQIRLEILAASGEVLTESRPENFSLPPTQEKTYEMRGIGRKDGKVRVLLNTAY